MGLAACGRTETPRDKLEKEGYKIFVTYDTNNGDFMGRKTLVDAFKPESFTRDADGKIHIKLLDPDDEKREGDTQLSPSLSQYFYVGWYRTREVVRNDDGAALDDNGNVILEDDEGFYVLDSENKRVAVRPAYTYSGRWDFDTDTVEYSDDEDIKDLRLYAAWVPYFEFRYYYEQGNEWVYYGSTSFDYKTTNAADSATFDYDMLWVPKWSDAGDTGYMNHDHVKIRQQNLYLSFGCG